jgi:serine/threonine protein kinase
LPYYLDFGHIVPTGIRSLLTDCSPELLDFVERLLTLDPKKRPTAKQLKSHAYLSGYDLRQAKL